MNIPGYTLREEIGKGGMATVYLATQNSLNRLVVLKLLDIKAYDKAEEMVQRFKEEGRILATLRHPNIVTIYDIGITNEDMYISMEYIEGGDLKQRLASTITPESALDIIQKIAHALGAAHHYNIIHRDVKPANILFRDDGTPLLTDFGIAKQTSHDKDLTSTGMFIGSPNYVSPEQIDGHYVDGRSDIYSLGCIFYEILTANKPYEGNSVIEIIIKHQTAPVPTLPNTLKEYQPLLDRMMAKTPDNRFADAKELVNEIEQIKQSKILKPEINTEEKIIIAKQKKKITILISLLIFSFIFFLSLQFVDIQLKKSSDPKQHASVKTVLTNELSAEQLLARQAEAEKKGNNAVTTDPKTPVSPEVKRALMWLGKQSLEEFKLTYPPMDNAFYYFSRLLELEPSNQQAVKGLLAIAERYAILAEESLVKNDIEKTRTFIEIGLQIDPNNQALNSLKTLLQNRNSGFWETLKSMF